MRPYLVVAVGCLLSATPLAPASAQDQSPQPKDWSFSLGVDSKKIGHNETLYSDDALMVANLTRTWQSSESRFARHVSLLAGSDLPYRLALVANDGCGGCGAPFTRRYLALTAGVSYDIVRVSRFTPYISAGTGAYYTRMNRNLDETRISIDARHFRSGLTLGANAGFGVKARFGSREIFVEQLIHLTDLGRLSKGIRPLNLGIRF
jgi:hypothetical protein